MTEFDLLNKENCAISAKERDLRAQEKYVKLEY